MRERSIIWDILVVLFLAVLVVLNGIAMLQTDRFEKIGINNVNATKRLEEGINGLRAKLDAQTGVLQRMQETGYTRPDESSPNVSKNQEKHSRSYSDGSKNPKWPRGDEGAPDGDSVILNMFSEPNSLNPIITNEATCADLWKFCNDRLIRRAYDDPNYWEPRLARAWEKGMICRGITTKKNAKELAVKLNEAWKSDAEREKLSISKIEAESDEILRIELSDAAGDYREPVLKILGADAIEPQQWFYIVFEGTKFVDGTELTAKAVGQRVRKAIESAPGFKGRFLPDWERSGSVVVQLVGGNDSAEDAIKKLIESDAAKGEVTDPKDPTGKTVRRVLTFDLAEKYIFEEKPVYTFYLRKGVKWSDGKPFTGKDIVFTFDTIMNPKVECDPARNYLQDCESVTLVDNDPNVVRFIWKKPYFLSFGVSGEMYILAEHVFRYDDASEVNKTPRNQELVGTGPYRLDKWDRKQQMVMVRNDDYWGVKPHLNKITVKFVNDPTKGLQLLQKGDLDVQSLSKKQAAQLRNDPSFNKNFKLEVSTSNVFRYIGWNIRRDWFATVKTRRALTMLVNRQAIVDNVFRGFATALDVPTHPESPVFPKNPDKLRIPFDLAQAKQLLAEDGWKDTDGDNVLDKVIDGKRVPFKFSLMIVSGFSEMESVANLVQDTFAQAGIVVNIRNLEASVFEQNIERLNFDAMISGWRVDVDDDPYQLFHSSQTVEKGSNHCGYVNKEVDRLIVEGRRELDDEKRAEMFRKVYEIISQEQPYTCLLVDKRTVGYDNRIQNVKYNIQGSQIVRWWVPLDRQKYK
jgi:peptide/nickel transport system substrate-binding protein